MKPTERERARLAERIRARRDELGYSDALLSRLSGVHASQVSRICRADFRTIGGNVVRICNALAVSIEAAPMDERRATDDWTKVEDAVRRVWDRTPDGATKLVRVMEAIAALGRG